MLIVILKPCGMNAMLLRFAAKEVREVRIVKLPQMRVVSPLQVTPPKVGYESDLGFTTNKTATAHKISNPQQLAMDTSTGTFF